MANLPALLEMLKAGAHFGHRTSKWHPNMEPFIFTDRNGVHIINLEKTQEQLEKAGEFLKNLGMEGGTLLFVGTKKQAQDIVCEAATKCEMPYVKERWIGGTLTNFPTIKKRVDHFVDLENKQKTGGLDKYTKKEQNDFGKEIEGLRRRIGGLVRLPKLPDAIFILDVKTEKTALREAKKKNIPVVAVCDTNVNPDGIKYPIPANDDALKSIKIIIEYIAEAFKEGKDLAPAKEQMKKIQEEKKKESGKESAEKKDKKQF
ncbi:MAG: 30S ribosomal protein S2 [Parcubacteria group bacterium CG10_big_fil_rev_8_21_14_0_10_36_14]|nr:MAG: 30S ribosomal protein S2 [Parcubacteria group bacterium CG10_big_fil_rev_8_21_14_0_10_36_14]